MIGKKLINPEMISPAVVEMNQDPAGMINIVAVNIVIKIGREVRIVGNIHPHHPPQTN